MVIEPGYLTISVKDVGPAMAFYNALFGWSFDHEEGTQSAHVNNTNLPLGLAGHGQADVRFIYFRVEDIAAVKARLIALDGKVLEENQFPSGLNAVCADDQGTIFSLWQPAPGF
jgi:predicted enzyme related to lactoylglutathione lyase